MNASRMVSRALAAAALASTGLQAADRFDPEPPAQPLGAIAPIELSTTNLSNGATAYRTWFENGAWQGDLIEYDVSNAGKLSTSIDLSDISPQQTARGRNWSANVQFREAAAANPDWWQARKVITAANGSQVRFAWANLTDAQKQALDQTAYDEGRATSDILNYLLGDRSNEHPAGSLRARESVLADIIYSNPTYVGPPSEALFEAGYAAFAASKSTRKPRIYVGSNGGMLHAFDAATGSEVYAYIPSMLIGNLARLAGRPYSHVYGVDGQITVKDANAGGWKTVLVGGLGAGGKGWYALDVTEEGLTNTTLMWELDAGNDDDMGYSFGQAVIARLNDGNWYAVFGNGYSSVNGQAVLYLVKLSNGDVKKISVGAADPDSPNGLSSPSLVDSDRDGKADIAFAGDIDGNLWKFDLTSANAAEWDDAYNGKPLHDGVPERPIVNAPDVTLHPLRGFLVFFGTGKLFTQADITADPIQAIYGIWDLRGDAPPTAANQNLQSQTLSGRLLYTSGDITEIVQAIPRDPGPIDWSVRDGWAVELPDGFKVITPVTLRGGRVKATAHNPETDENYTIEPYYVDGGPPPTPIFDLNQSDSLTIEDNVDGNEDGDLADSSDVVLAWKLPSGLMSRTTIGRVSNGIDAQLINYLVPPLADEPCVEACLDGFAGGHIDVDTDWYRDADGVGGIVNEHTHEYDKIAERVYVDYRDHGAVAAEYNHVEIDAPGTIPLDARFIVVVANADMSPAAELVLGDREYNVVEYQAMIHRKLREWGGGAEPLNDGQGNSLIFDMPALVAADGTVRHGFNDKAIVGGGLHPTNTGCVINADNVTNGRYRNGSLVMQFINVDVFDACDGCLNEVTVQDPADLPEVVLLGDGTRVAMKEDLDGDGAIDPGNFEVFGGIRGRAAPGVTDVLFESTLYWHYPGEACYGDPEWEAEVEAFRSQFSLTEDEWLQLLEDAGYGGKDIDEEYQRVLQCLAGDDAEAAKNCEKELGIIERLLELRDLMPVDNGADDDGLGADGETPVTMGGEASDLGVTAGPNFELGRRTWTDIFDE